MKLSERFGNARLIVNGRNAKNYPIRAEEDQTEYIDFIAVAPRILKDLRDNGVYEAIRSECENLDDSEVKIDVWAAKFKTEGGWYDIAHIYVPRCWR